MDECVNWANIQFKKIDDAKAAAEGKDAEPLAKPTSGGAAAACWCHWNNKYRCGRITWAEYLKRTAWSRDETQQKFLDGLAKGV